mmetsp:Transcript_105182/g.274582  ORF Transcript_105182/g.274582 Transcript_105182/m.274582 type:complete len:267 (+) Transcript_105182:384-1184(+)
MQGVEGGGGQGREDAEAGGPLGRAREGQGREGPQRRLQQEQEQQGCGRPRQQQCHQEQRHGEEGREDLLWIFRGLLQDEVLLRAGHAVLRQEQGLGRVQGELQPRARPLGRGLVPLELRGGRRARQWRAAAVRAEWGQLHGKQVLQRAGLHLLLEERDLCDLQAVLHSGPRLRGRGLAALEVLEDGPHQGRQSRLGRRGVLRGRGRLLEDEVLQDVRQPVLREGGGLGAVQGGVLHGAGERVGQAVDLRGAGREDAVASARLEPWP